MNKIDIAVIIAYLVGTTLFGCSFFFRRKNYLSSDTQHTKNIIYR